MMTYEEYELLKIGDTIKCIGPVGPYYHEIGDIGKIMDKDGVNVSIYWPSNTKWKSEKAVLGGITGPLNWERCSYTGIDLEVVKK